MDISLLYTAESIAAFFGFGFGCLVLNEATDAEVLTSRLLAIRDDALAAHESGDEARVAALAAEFDSVDAQLRVLERQNRVAELEQSPGARTQPGPRANATPAAPAQRTASRPVQAGASAGGWKEQFARAMVANQERIQQSPGGFQFSIQNAVLTSEVGTTVNAGLRGPGVVFGAQNAFGTQAVSGSSVEYSRYSSTTGAVAAQTEGSAKASVDPNWTVITEAVKTFAGITRCSEQALDDQPALAGAVATQLERSHAAAEDEFFANALEGFSSSFTDASVTLLADLVLSCKTTMTLAGFMPTAVVMTSAAWIAMVTQKASTAGTPLNESYLNTELGTLHGMPVILSDAMGSDSPSVRAILVDGTQCVRGIRQGLNVRTNYSGEDFEKNLLTVRAESRSAPLFYSVGAARKIV